MTLPNGLSTANKNPDRREEREHHRRGNPKEPDRRKEPSPTLPCVAICAALLAFGLYFLPWINNYPGWDAADYFQWPAGAAAGRSLGIAKYSMLVSTPCTVLAGISAIERKTSFAGPLLMFASTLAAAVFSIPAAFTVTSVNMPDLFKANLIALVPIGVPLLLVTAACAAGVELERRRERICKQIDDLRQAVANLHSDGGNLHLEDDGGDLHPDGIERRIEELHSRIHALELNAGAQRPADARRTKGDVADSQQPPNTLSDSRQPSDEPAISPQMRGESSETDEAGQ